MQTLSEQDVSLFARPQAYRMRCPHCQKLYSVEASLVSGSDQKLNFECVNCDQSFVALSPGAAFTESLETIALERAPVAAPVAVSRATPQTASTSTVSSAATMPVFELALPDIAIVQEPTVSKFTEAPLTAFTSVAVEPAPLNTRECPKCGSMNARGQTECTSCGVLIARYQAGEEERVTGEIEFTGNLDLVSLWDDVALNYQNFAKHEAFVAECGKANCLQFAAQKYSVVLAGAPEEETARQMRKRIIGLASMKFESGASVSKANWRMPLPSFNSLIIVLGTIAFFVGLAVPQVPELKEIGAAMLALAIGLRIFLRRPA